MIEIITLTLYCYSTTYYFGHGAVQYLEVDNEEEEAMMPKLADRSVMIFC